MSAQVLSVQSHVVYGYVGNRAATFPLQRIGHEVWSLNTVQFSNHTGYGAWRGEVVPGEVVQDLFVGLEERGVLAQANAVLSGYIGDVSLARELKAKVSELKAKNPDILYCCDPVMGDVGRGFFVREGIFEYFRDELIQEADIITPNQFEAEHLTGETINTLDDAKRVVAKLHEMGPRYVVITSLRHNGLAGDSIEVLVSEQSGECWVIKTPLFPFDPMPNGCGDMLTALTLGYFLKGDGILNAVEKTIEGVYRTLELTFELGRRELALVQAQETFASPQIKFEGIKVSYPEGEE